MILSAVTGSPEREIWRMTLGAFMHRMREIAHVIPFTNPFAEAPKRSQPGATVGGRKVQTMDQLIGYLAPFSEIRQA